MHRSPDSLEAASILIVDDEDLNVRLLERLLKRRGFANITGTTNARAIMQLYVEQEPDLVLLDLHMPQLNGFQVLELLREQVPADVYLPVLVLTADATRESRERALELGANDFLTKPFDATEVALRVRNLLMTRSLYLRLRAQNDMLEARVRERTRRIELAQDEILRRLALAAEYRDDDTGEHTQRVGRLAAMVGHALGLPGHEVEALGKAAQLHDLGKIGIPDHILLKPGKLTAEEFELIRTHAAIGARILSGSDFPILTLAAEIAAFHHERWDGTGYPHGLTGEQIPIVARIVAVVDVCDALTHDRPYKPAWPLEDALAELERQRGRQFDPSVVDAFLEIVRSPEGHDILLGCRRPVL